MDSASLIFAIIVLLIGLGISYFVIKCAVRNGINESLLFANKERWEKVRNDFPDLSSPHTRTATTTTPHTSRCKNERYKKINGSSDIGVTARLYCRLWLKQGNGGQRQSRDPVGS